ncbi:MAG TPA: asparagine synthase (glutamine-hydrolyzing) [Candidatus Sulfotelmatobacter sp.]
MCGIYGVFDPSSRIDDDLRAWAQRAQDLLRHRGPDDRGCEERLQGRCLLGHTRLSIIDLAGGKQPLRNEDETIWVICNGEIYNYVELRARLIEKGHRFRTQSDCEVLVHLYEEKGEKLLDDLVGMYAFVLLDEKNRRVLAARDPLGEKPLYWARFGDRGFAFASEMKAMVPFPGLDRKLDIAAVAQFLALRCIPAPRTHLRGVRKLAAGEALIADAASGIRTWRYWRPELPVNGNLRPPSVAEAVEQIRNRVRESVRLRLRSDVPVAAFLSGGIDSTMVVTSMRELMPGAKFSTFCASFDDKELDESPYARVVAERVGSDHHEIHFTSEQMLDSFEALIDHYDEPFADASMFPTFAVCRAARLHCKVMLSGDGGDECFAGYREFFSYYPLHALRRFPGMNSTAGALLDHWNTSWRGIGLLRFLSSTDWRLLYPEVGRAKVLQHFRASSLEEATLGLEELKKDVLRHARLPYPRSAIEATTTTYLPEQILVKVDRASMRSALECRSPFLDRQLLDFVWALPARYHFERGLGKALLRRALPDWVPDKIRWRAKRGFTPPLATWLRTSMHSRMSQAISDAPESLRHILDLAPVQQLFNDHLAGADCSDQLFRWLVLSRRCREVEPA